MNLHHLSKHYLIMHLLPTPFGIFKIIKYSSEQLSNRNIRDITTHKVYPQYLLPNKGVRSYHTVSPLLQLKLQRFSFCDTIYLPIILRSPPVKWYGALSCPDFPHPNTLLRRDEEIAILFRSKFITKFN